MKIKVNADLDADAVVEALSARSLVRFIIDLDEAVQDWSVTLKLCDYFDEQRRIHAEELGGEEN